MAGVEGRAVLVTGGATAVGRALAIDLAAHGASVAVIDVDDEHGDECVARIADAAEGPSTGTPTCGSSPRSPPRSTR